MRHSRHRKRRSGAALPSPGHTTARERQLQAFRAHQRRVAEKEGAGLSCLCALQFVRGGQVDS